MKNRIFEYMIDKSSFDTTVYMEAENVCNVTYRDIQCYYDSLEELLDRSFKDFSDVHFFMESGDGFRSVTDDRELDETGPVSFIVQFAFRGQTSWKNLIHLLDFLTDGRKLFQAEEICFVDFSLQNPVEPVLWSDDNFAVIGKEDYLEAREQNRIQTRSLLVALETLKERCCTKKTNF